MEIMLVPVIMLAIVGVAYASTSDMHSCTKCSGVSTEDYGLMQVSSGKKTILNPRGAYWTHTSCSSFRTKE